MVSLFSRVYFPPNYENIISRRFMQDRGVLFPADLRRIMATCLLRLPGIARQLCENLRDPTSLGLRRTRLREIPS
jgi:hypothetical protein